MYRFWLAVVIMVFVLVGNHETQSYRVEIQALDASEPLLRLQKPLQTHSKDEDFLNELHQETLAEVLLSMGDVPMENITDTCRFIMQHMAEQGSAFTGCLLSHARPFRMCEMCIVYYTHFTHLYQDLLNDQRCAPVLLLADRMQVLTTVYSTFTSTWSQADCSKCYESVEENVTTGEVLFNYTADTLMFQEMHANVTQCFNVSDTIDSRGENAVCKNCRSIYKKMNDKYSALQSNSNGHICMDLVDMMNYTRLMWSSKFKCTRPRPDASIVITLCVIIFVITILLYLTSKFIAKIRMPQIFKAKRMATGSGRYGALSREEVETSLPRFATVSPAYTTCAERRRGDSNRDVDGNGFPAQSS